jgi:hypothetical protein
VYTKSHLKRRLDAVDTGGVSNATQRLAELTAQANKMASSMSCLSVSSSSASSSSTSSSSPSSSSPSSSVSSLSAAERAQISELYAVVRQWDAVGT